MAIKSCTIVLKNSRIFIGLTVCLFLSLVVSYHHSVRYQPIESISLSYFYKVRGSTTGLEINILTKALVILLISPVL
jgi:hypothetical protein